MKKGFVLGTVLILMAALLIGCEDTKTQGPPSSSAQRASSSSSKASSPKAALEQLESLLTKTASTKESGAVSVEVSLNSPEFFQALSLWESEGGKGDQKAILQSYKERYDLDRALVFTVYMNTHSVDLDKFRVESLALLRTGQGKEYQATRWEEDKDSGGHHRSGKLLFSNLDGEGGEVLKSAKYLELVIRDLAGVRERVFRWDLPIAYPPGLERAWKLRDG